MTTISDPYYYAYIAPCLNCDGTGHRPAQPEGEADPYLFICSTCDKKQEKGVLLNSKRMFLNNVG